MMTIFLETGGGPEPLIRKLARHMGHSETGDSIFLASKNEEVMKTRDWETHIQHAWATYSSWHSPVCTRMQLQYIVHDQVAIKE